METLDHFHSIVVLRFVLASVCTYRKNLDQVDETHTQLFVVTHVGVAVTTASATTLLRATSTCACL